MKSDTSAWMPEGQNCCSRSSPNAKNAPRSRAPPTPPSANGAPPSPTRAWPRPSSTDSPSTPTSSTPAPTPTGSEPPEQRTEAPPSKKPPSPTPPPRHRAPAEPQKNTTMGGANSNHHNGAKWTCHSHTPRKHTKGSKPTHSKRARPAWDPARHPQAWRAVWQYRRKRAVRDERTLNQQRNRALAVIDGESKPKPVRFVQTKGAARTFNQDSYDKASDRAGWKGYGSNIPAQVRSAEEVVSSYHDLWTVQQSFRMAKSDLDARPSFHHTRQAIEAHLTGVFASLAVARYMYAQTGITTPKIVKALKPLQEVTITVAGQQITANPEITEENRRILTHLNALP